jgi:pyruvate,water dikinase
MHHGIGKVSIAVIVQKMLDAERSGVMFTADPTTNDSSRMVIEASFGLGEAVVSGQVTPDMYVVDKDTGKVVAAKIGRKLWMEKVDRAGGETTKVSVPAEKVGARVLTNPQIAKLVELGRKLEEHFQKAQDIEWSEERGRLFLLQTRAVTTLGVERPERPEHEEMQGRVLVTGSGASPGVAKGRVRVVRSIDDLEKIENGDILVARMTNPDMVPYMKKAAAIVTEEGGTTSHAAIVSRELGIPCVVGTGDALSKLQDGQEVVVDATNGKVYAAAGGVPEAAATASMESPGELFSSGFGGEIAPPHADGITATSIKVNISFAETADRFARKADGVGLVRAEHMLTESGKHPVFMARENPEGLTAVVERELEMIARAFHPKPVWYRTLDARTDEFRRLRGGEGEPQEANPMLGWHGIRRSLEQQEVFRCEIEAIRRLRQRGLDNVGIMLPFVSRIEEFRAARALVTFPVPLGIMVETPAAAMQMEGFCREGIAFASIGTNDLTQLALGVDRGSAHLSGLYDERNHGVMALIKQAIGACKKAGIEISVCGESASNPELAARFVEMGIDSLSVEGDAIEAVRQAVARTERKLLLDRARGF